VKISIFLWGIIPFLSILIRIMWVIIGMRNDDSFMVYRNPLCRRARLFLLTGGNSSGKSTVLKTNPKTPNPTILKI